MLVHGDLLQRPRDDAATRDADRLLSKYRPVILHRLARLVFYIAES
jgi:hypothetical protein